MAVTVNGDSIDDVVSMTVTPGVALDPVKDQLGSVHAWVNSNTGSIEQKQTYSTYGETTFSQISPILAALGMQRGFTGREYDVDTKLQHNRARWYNPTTGRFLSEDPIGFKAGDTNLYRYVKNKPITRRDPFGLQDYSYAGKCQKQALDDYWDRMNSGMAPNKCEAMLRREEFSCNLQDLYQNSGHSTEYEDFMENVLYPPGGVPPEMVPNPWTPVVPPGI